MFKAILSFTIATLLCASSCLAQAQTPTHDDQGLRLLASDGVVDIHGYPVKNLTYTNTKLIVLIFGSTDCPISNRYIPEVARLRKLFGPADARFPGEVRFFWVYPNANDTLEMITAHNKEFEIEMSDSMGTLIDQKTQVLVHAAHATTTPESAVFANDNGSLRLVYHGRLDNKYISFGRERQKADQHDLEVAIRAALDGKPAPEPGGPPVGCSIVYAQH